MDYKKILRLHFVNHLSSCEIVESCGDCVKTTANKSLKRFRKCQGLSAVFYYHNLFHRYYLEV